MNIEIRECRQEDFDAVYRMICLLEDQTMDRKSMKAVFEKNIASPEKFYRIAVADQKPAGFVSLHLQGLLHHGGYSAEITELVVMPEYRNLKIGSRLYDCVFRIALDQGVKVFEVASNRTREDAHRFYETHGLVKSHYKFTRNFD